MINKKRNSGITLIALVITIIVLLILAGVTISTLTGDNGLLQKANEAKTVTEKSAIREEIDLLLLRVQAGDKLEDIFGSNNVKKDNAVYEVSYKGNDFLVSDDNEYIEKVEPAYEGEWTFDASTQTLTAYKGDLTTKRGNQEIGEVIIPNYYNGKRVKIIGSSIFYSYGKDINLTKIKISDGIEILKPTVFYFCSKLKGDLILPDSVTTLEGYGMFFACGSLDGKLKLSKNLKEIGAATFCSCSKLTGNVEIADGVRSIQKQTFQNCSSIESIKFLNKDTEIYDESSTIYSKIKIIGYKGSTAEKYATKYNRTFEAIPE